VSDPDPTQRLLERWKGGDRAAFEFLVTDALPWLHAEVRHSMGRQARGIDDSMDVVQSVATSFLRWAPRFVPANGAQFRALLKRIACNELIDRRRMASGRCDRRHVDSVLDFEDHALEPASPSRSSQAPDRASEKREDQQWVRLALQFLSADDRYLLVAREVEKLDWSSIAQEVGLDSPDAARVRCSRIKARVANLLRRLRSSRYPESA
jgi:RNA polymerase sigma factor (sigma-70 family)